MPRSRTARRWPAGSSARWRASEVAARGEPPRSAAPSLTPASRRGAGGESLRHALGAHVGIVRSGARARPAAATIGAPRPPDCFPTFGSRRPLPAWFLVRRHLLAPPRSLPARAASVLTVIDHLGLLQFDPLEVPGARNHDLVLHARIRGYRRGWCERWLYGRDRRLIEIYNKSLNIVPMGELPHYAIAWDRSGRHYDGTILRDQAAVADAIVAQIRRRRPAVHRVLQGAQPRGRLVVGADLRRASGDGGAVRQRPAWGSRGGTAIGATTT